MVYRGNIRWRCPSMDSIMVSIDVSINLVSIYNNGEGIPVEKEGGVFVPEIYFGHLLTGINNLGRQLGLMVGSPETVKVRMLFLRIFVLDVLESGSPCFAHFCGGLWGGVGYCQLYYVVYSSIGSFFLLFLVVRSGAKFTDNMRLRTQPIIEECGEEENWTRITFKPDLAKFNMIELESDMIALMKKRVFDLAACLDSNVEVKFNGQSLENSFIKYVDYYLKTVSKTEAKPPSAG
ncbi:DNA topoisomerase 2-like [Hibiscus syriacus]|uniref:DNA topoisomerase 2-like n=1 Tax=Hibiscus syriacus TaxID=106335 RepID=UPI0019207B85|nr:DNA topoisomerase 2-like [Hibiscus syriacus]